MRRTFDAIPVAELHELFVCDALAGKLIRKVFCGGRPAGEAAGALNRVNGYTYVSVRLRKVLVHRAIWAMTHGEWPVLDIDHINGDRSDNRLANLRVATRQQNIGNSGKRRNNTSGYKGVTAYKGRWRAQIGAAGYRKALGVFDTPELAHAAYCAAARVAYGDFARAA